MVSFLVLVGGGVAFKRKVYLCLFAFKKKGLFGNSPDVQWLGLCTSTAGGMGSIPGQGTKIPHATLCSQRKKKKKIYLCLPIVNKY